MGCLEHLSAESPTSGLPVIRPRRLGTLSQITLVSSSQLYPASGLSNIASRAKLWRGAIMTLEAVGGAEGYKASGAGFATNACAWAV